MARSAFAITVAKNEDFFLPRWINYYSGQIGMRNLYVIDHGSTDLSIHTRGEVNIIRVPSSPYNEYNRVEAVSDLHSSLLNYYDCGFVCDTDEFIASDPRFFRNLQDFVDQTEHQSLSAIGLELLHIPDLEGDFLAHLPILNQRHTVYFSTAVCKSCFAAKRTRFSGGFHASTNIPAFDTKFYLFHLKHFDYKWRLARQYVTRSWEYSGNFGDHAKRDLESTKQFVDGLIDRFTRQHADGFDFSVEINKALASVEERHGRHVFSLDFFSEASRTVPNEFSVLF